LGVKVAIGGKGGVGKTTVCAVWSQLLAEDDFDVLAIDADSDTNLAWAFGIPSAQSPEPLIKMKELIAERSGTGKEEQLSYDSAVLATAELLMNKQIYSDSFLKVYKSGK